jgi:threonine synthase
MAVLMEWSRHEGIFAAPEGAAALAAYKRLLEERFFQRGQKVVLFNTGSGLKYIDVVAQYLREQGNEQQAAELVGAAAEQRGPRAIGGIIQPY